ncbi:DUF4492 domain-containing protein [Porphyromonas levii]|uniref:DUF4492 domain-containing protein n=1 Tax=Porphyromonas levii TaxID=28114 RepID=A0A4Y8WQZ2_9PORP|nr:DUF4492 domain-containing protein [Porphyromonas levii]MBR8702434.1 hypothetical protein [Porphyromonas levii]MBR8713415.1 hypothetical protein [Porphyromonas levii]MBR8715448.1 hypothetical protein [Porphyromonas levii]MBR8727973.1 hypothetical protein [Porphyromonas levii]MBR8729188.1 hypothetical protein [Porphyromonas levii]
MEEQKRKGREWGGFFPQVIRLWKEGLKSMTWGKPLWILNIIKLLILFGVLKLFFFPNFLKQKSDTEEGKRDYIVNELKQRSAATDGHEVFAPEQRQK